MFVALGIRFTKRMRHIAILGLPRCTIFSHIIPWTARFSKKKKITGHKMCFDFLYKFVWKKLFILRRTGRDMIKNVCWSMKKKKLPDVICVLIFCTNLSKKKLFSLRRTERDMIKNVCWSSKKKNITGHKMCFDFLYKFVWKKKTLYSN